MWLRVIVAIGELRVPTPSYLTSLGQPLYTQSRACCDSLKSRGVTPQYASLFSKSQLWTKDGMIFCKQAPKSFVPVQAASAALPILSQTSPALAGERALTHKSATANRTIRNVRA
jgi:hypothetical protein